MNQALVGSLKQQVGVASGYEQSLGETSALKPEGSGMNKLSTYGTVDNQSYNIHMYPDCISYRLFPCDNALNLYI